MSETLIPRELHGVRLWFYNLGYFGMSLTNIFMGVYVFQFYVYTINLDSIIVSIGIALQLIIFAISAVVFGIMADNKKPGKLGKRRPFLLYGLPIWFLTSILLWLPPYCPKNNSIYWPTAIYFWVIIIINATSGMMILSPLSSMLPEQSQTHKNREKVASVGTILMIISSIFALLMPLIIQSILPDPENVKWWEPSGKVVLLYVPIIGGAFAISGVIAIILTFFSVDESFHKSTQDIGTKKVTIRVAFQQMIVPAKDKKYRKFLLVAFFTSISGQILGILVFPFLTYVLEFRGTEYFLYIIVSFSSKFGWFLVWKKILKKHSLIKSYSMCIAFSVIASFLELIFLVGMLSFELKIVLFIITIGTILGCLYGFSLFTGPLISALIYEAASKTENDVDKKVSEISGAYFGLQSFLISSGSAVASIFVGIILMGPNAENSIIITICMASMGLFYLISLLFLIQIKININESDIKKME